MIFSRNTVKILDSYIDTVNWADILNIIMHWSCTKKSSYICICNVHSIITATQNTYFRQVINNADMATPDGAPIAWMLRRLGQTDQQRINGPDLMWRYCEQAQSRAEPIFFYGGSENTLALLKEKLLAAFPQLIVGGAISPPYRDLSAEEDAVIVAEINASSAGVVFVGLGCPKQELWMAAHRGRINSVMIGVGAAFDYHAGTIKRAPQWMQDFYLEWLFRLAAEPRRLWRRYLVTNTLFTIGVVKQLLRGNTN